MDTPHTRLAELTRVTHRFGSTTALDRITFALQPGEVVALLGPNGAGKTTLARILLGLVRPTEGTVRLNGLPATTSAARHRVGAMLQVSKVPEMLTVREHVRLFSSYYGTPVAVDETLRVAGVEAFADTRFGRLSGGQRQRALFALAVCGRPDVLVLDEPTVGLDIEARRGFWTTVRAFMARGCAVLLTTHYLEEADAVADRVVILHEGRLVTEGSPTAIKRRIASKRIRCTTSLDPIGVRAIFGVRDSAREGDTLVVTTDAAERVVRELLARDPQLRDLEVSGVRLEEAFVALTSAQGGSDVDVAVA